MLRQISLAWRNIKNNRRTIGLLSLDNWRGVNLWRNKNELSTLALRGMSVHCSLTQYENYIFSLCIACLKCNAVLPSSQKDASQQLYDLTI